LSQSYSTPRSCSSRRAVRISTNCGTWPRRHSSSVSSEANSNGRAAFLDPLTAISPRNGTPPRTTILSIPLALSERDNAHYVHQSQLQPVGRLFCVFSLSLWER